MTDSTAHVVMLHPAGQVAYGHVAPEESAYQAIRREIPGLSSQGMGRLRAWFTAEFGPDLQHNPPLADAVLAAIGYRHQTGWFGPVALTMEEDGTGEVLPLSSEVRAMVDELADQHAARG